MVDANIVITEGHDLVGIPIGDQNPQPAWLQKPYMALDHSPVASYWIDWFSVLWCKTLLQLAIDKSSINEAMGYKWKGYSPRLPLMDAPPNVVMVLFFWETMEQSTETFSVETLRDLSKPKIDSPSASTDTKGTLWYVICRQDVSHILVYLCKHIMKSCHRFRETLAPCSPR